MAPGQRRQHIDPERADVTRRLTIPMPFIHEEDDPGDDRRAPIFVEPTGPLWLRNIAEVQARCFTYATPWGGMPYYAKYPGPSVVVLLPTEDWGVGDGAYYPGAVGVNPEGSQFSEGHPVVQWYWVHPFARIAAGRQRSVIEKHWPRIMERWPDLTIDGPFTRAGRSLALKLGTPVTPGWLDQPTYPRSRK